MQKERDLELAAKIGQTLLTKNQELSEKNDVLEEHLSLLNEKVRRLLHNLQYFENDQFIYDINVNFDWSSLCI